MSSWKRLVPGRKKFMGREYIGTIRSTFLVDPKGRVAHVWPTVKPSGHAKEVLAVLKELRRYAKA